ncbi:dihydrodipicolinate synthase family protein [Anaeromyxobacter oryzisoli]|uniref:dihydrodipicolinate synthase family protein n=1 Tax=Anaeromyxobacter oryzisoli TaxID=2925408 RepID=UPI001F5AAAC5|nr:dihydrodipicolinate synthase family protein [Anaeromyxobacter sp. SG63]
MSNSGNSNMGRRSLLKATAIAGAGMLLGGKAEADERQGGARRHHTPPRRITGVLAPAITPFQAGTYKPDVKRYIRHCRWLLSHGCSALAIFGTNSEANSMSLEEREQLLYELADGGVNPSDLMPGTGACDVPSAVRLTRAAVSVGASGQLMLPPFYYKGVPDDGLFRYYSEVIQRVGDSGMRIYLYHIPGTSGVAIPLPVIERLVKAYPVVVAGMKDSGNNFTFTQSVISAVGSVFDVFVGSEQWLLQNMRAGGVGCISATANVNPGAIDRLFRTWQAADADAQQAALNVVRGIFSSFPMIPALKYAVSYYGADPAWPTVRAPWVELTAAQGAQLVSKLAAVGFTMPGLQTTR